MEKLRFLFLFVILFFLLILIIVILPLTSAQPSYIYGPTGIVAAVDDDYTHYFITDDEGSVVRTINESGDVIRAREYEPDGKNFFKYDASTPFDTSVPIGWQGYREDEDTGLVGESYDSGTGGYIGAAPGFFGSSLGGKALIAANFLSNNAINDWGYGGTNVDMKEKRRIS